MATKKINLAALSFAFIFAACGDESATESTPLYTTVVGDVGELPDCLSKNEGEQAFVTNESAFRICANGKWYSASQNINGSFDFHCSTEPLADSSGLKILCGGDSIGVLLNGRNGENGSDGKDGSDNTVVKNGKDGKDGVDGKDGKDGVGCTAVVLSDNSGMKILCGGDSVGVVLNGRDGERGADGKNGTNGTDGQNGANGEGCTLKQIDVNNLRIKCGGDSAMIFVNEVFNPSSSSSQVIQSSSSHALENFVETRDNLALCDASYKSTRILVKQDSLYFGCDGVKWIPDSTRGYLVKSVSVLGAAQKGPFKFGTPLELRELRLYNDTLRYSGIKYVDEISSNKGNYVIPKVSLVYPYAEIAVRGLWRNEVSGVWSTDSMTLQALTDLSNRTDANVNLLTHLEYARAMKLVEKGYSVSAAKKQADYEIMTAFGFATTIKFSEDLSIFEDYDDNLWYDAANATLLAMSILFMENRNDAEILSAIETFRQDIAEDGEWNATDAEKTKAAMADWAESFDKTVVRANVKSWNVLEIPDYEEYLDVFWNNVYGLGGCDTTRFNVVSLVTNKLSANYNIHYICKTSNWQKATDFEKDTYQWLDGKDGDVRAGNVNANKFYVYENGKWRASISTVENDLGACVTNRNNEVGKSGGIYYTCKSKIWEKSTALEYDTYGWPAGTEGEMKEGNVEPSNHYVCENGEWREAKAGAEYLSGVCMTEREGEKVKDDLIEVHYYVCESKMWKEITAIEYDYGYCTASNEGRVGKVNDDYYICKSKYWNAASLLECDTYGWLAGIEGEMKEGNVDPLNHYVYENGAWREPVNEMEYEYGACVVDKNGNVQKLNDVYYICKSGAWTTATVLEYDTYGKSCSKDGSVVSGEVLAENKYVCDAGIFRVATEMEISLNEGCVSYTENDEISKHFANDQDSVYVCKNSLWKGLLYGRLLDARDKQIYKTVSIGEQIWMAENLNYADSANYPGMEKRNWCYDNDLDNCVKYGRLYTWAAAMDSAGTFSTNGKNCGYSSYCSPTYPVRGICPEGWHLPTVAEWHTLDSTMGSSPYAMMAVGYAEWPDATDAYGFSALPAGYSEANNYYMFGVVASFWSDTDAGASDRYAYYKSLNRSGSSIYSFFKYYGRSVRCLQDSP